MAAQNENNDEHQKQSNNNNDDDHQKQSNNNDDDHQEKDNKPTTVSFNPNLNHYKVHRNKKNRSFDMTNEEKKELHEQLTFSSSDYEYTVNKYVHLLEPVETIQDMFTLGTMCCKSKDPTKLKQGIQYCKRILEYEKSKPTNEADKNDSEEYDEYFANDFGATTNTSNSQTTSKKTSEKEEKDIEECKRDVLYFIALAYYRLQDYHKAKLWLKKLLQKDPGNIQGKKMLCLVDEILGKKQNEQIMWVGGITAGALVAGLAGVTLVGLALLKK